MLSSEGRLHRTCIEYRRFCLVGLGLAVHLHRSIAQHRFQTHLSVTARLPGDTVRLCHTDKVFPPRNRMCNPAISLE